MSWWDWSHIGWTPAVFPKPPKPVKHHPIQRARDRKWFYQGASGESDTVYKCWITALRPQRMRRRMPTMNQLLLPTKANLLKVAVESAGTPYLWGGKGEMMHSPTGPKAATYFGLDCSGAYTYWVLKVSGPDLRFTHNTDKMWQERPTVEIASVQPGDLAFWGGAGPDDVEHVEMVLAILPSGAIVTIGSSGGGSRTLSLEKALEQNARVKVRTGVKVGRADFRGFRAGYI